ncbi:bifunctional nicotinamidase/pyrazinamidase [Nitrospirillum viridazoti]|uniref:Nicotinamidase n=1 Tax=Nitrospirillum viridazoti CBAmc TaxID=1441467 RepID=A0A248JV45_9PROT|nr:bifunctional nicotinamidase/pyrazinamidase [Nitrospirillum amazonense]ASG22565.1 nicotinamidase [Nitrospirillum amazonense CBAmc]TWB42871.1 nicotinamidase/pyrazinamidase [Nitrospirillum amazonense]
MHTDTDALILIDIQNDFCPGGALAVKDGDAVVEPANDLAAHFNTVILTQDWHPAGHLSFASAHPGHRPYDMVQMPYGPQMLWPDHCVQGSAGAAFHPGLAPAVEKAQLVVRKGFRPHIDSYSAFFENDKVTPTGLAGALRERGIHRIYLAGLATDYCVAYSATDAARLGFEALIVEDACRAIDLHGSLTAARRDWMAAGVRSVSVADVLALAAPLASVA